MNRRILGSTGLEVSEIGFGAWQLCNGDSWGGMDEQTALRLVDEAVAGGINLFDTAPNYAATRSERVLGKALKNKRDEVVLVSKFGHTPERPKNFSVDWFWESLDASLGRLQTDYLDVLLLHNPPGDIYAGTDPLWAALEEARAQGKIRHYGASLDFATEVEDCLANTRSEVLEVLFNVFHQDVRRAFATVRERDAGIITKVPLDSGWLTGRFDAGSRAPASWPPARGSYGAGMTEAAVPTPALFDLSGHVAVVTGGSRGLGREMVLAFAEHGADDGHHDDHERGDGKYGEERECGGVDEGLPGQPVADGAPEDLQEFPDRLRQVVRHGSQALFPGRHVGFFQGCAM